MATDKLNDKLPSKPKQNGGIRPGAGRPPGSLNPATKVAMAVKQEYQSKIRRNADKLFNAQFSLATGLQMLFVIHTDSKGVRRKPEMITNPDIITRFLEENEGVDGTMDMGDHADGSKVEDFFFITTKIPDSRTITDMLDRGLGKPDATLDITSGGESLLSTRQLSEDELNDRIRQYLERHTAN